MSHRRRRARKQCRSSLPDVHIIWAQDAKHTMRDKGLASLAVFPALPSPQGASGRITSSLRPREIRPDPRTLRSSPEQPAASPAGLHDIGVLGTVRTNEQVRETPTVAHSRRTSFRAKHGSHLTRAAPWACASLRLGTDDRTTFYEIYILAREGSGQWKQVEAATVHEMLRCEIARCATRTTRRSTASMVLNIYHGIHTPRRMMDGGHALGDPVPPRTYTAHGSRPPQRPIYPMRHAAAVLLPAAARAHIRYAVATVASCSPSSPAVSHPPRDERVLIANMTWTIADLMRSRKQPGQRAFLAKQAIFTSKGAGRGGDV